MKKRVILLAALFVLAGIASVRAAAITVPNFSFEDCPLPDGGFVYNPADVWAYSPINTGGVQNPDSGFYSPAGLAMIDGQMVAFSNGGTISQMLAANLAPSTLYTLSVLVGDRTDVNNVNTDWAIRLYAGSTLLSETTKSNTLVPVPDTMFATETIGYVSPASGPLLGQALKIELYSSDIQYNFDKVQLDATAVLGPAAVPTPSAALGGIATLAMLLGWRRMKTLHV